MNNKIELRPCPFCVGKYYCDTEGNIYNSKGRRIKPYDNGYGYLIVDIRIMGKRKHIKVHRIIATAFIPNPHLLPEVNHKDEDKHNNAPRIWEPACGAGHMANVLAANGYEVKATDLIDRGFGTGGIDFLAQAEKWNGDIITNPPYKFAAEFVEKALELVADGAKVAMFLKLTFLEGKTRRAMFNSTPPPARLGVVLASAMRHQRRLRRNVCDGLRVVRVAKGLQGRHDSEMV